MLKSMIYIVVKNDPDEATSTAGDVGKNDYDEIITPLLVLLRKLAEEDNGAKTLIREELLPDNM
jgi:hypothetical protein